MGTLTTNGAAHANGKASSAHMSASVEVVYRGVFQKTLANRVARGIVLGARKEGRVGTAFARYGDSPERNGIPAKNFAVVASDQDELEKSLARYEPDSVDVSIVVDDTMCKGIESWAWYGVQPINKLVQPGGYMVVFSDKTPDQLLQWIQAKDAAYTLVVVPTEMHKGVFAPDAIANYAGFWGYNDDNTDYYAMAAVAAVDPGVLSLDSVLTVVREQTKDDKRVEQVRAMAGKLLVRPVKPGEGSKVVHEEYAKPGWKQMREGIVVDAMKVGTRNPVYKKWSTRTSRPLVNFDTCIKCTQCWLQCPDECFEVTPEGTYEVVYEACIGCGVCADVCPVPDCITMVNELEFGDIDSLYTVFKKDPAAYKAILQEHGINLHPELVEKGRKTPAVHDVKERKWPLAVASGEG